MRHLGNKVALKTKGLWPYGSWPAEAVFTREKHMMAKGKRTQINKLEDLPNVGKAIATHLRAIGIESPDQLRGQNPVVMYEKLAIEKGRRQDPCVLDVFMSVVSFIEGGPALPWWAFTEERKKCNL